MGALSSDFFSFKVVLNQVAVQMKAQAAQVPKQISCLSQWDSAALQKQIDDLNATNTSKSFYPPLLILLLLVHILDNFVLLPQL
jgi:hypothetical protein